MTSIRITDAADAQIEEIDDWWRDNRTAAPDLFREELESAFERLAGQPKSGRAFPRPRYPDLRRTLLRRTAYQVYYIFLPMTDEVEVRAVWHARRGRGPPI